MTVDSKTLELVIYYQKTLHLVNLWIYMENLELSPLQDKKIKNIEESHSIPPLIKTKWSLGEMEIPYILILKKYQLP